MACSITLFLKLKMVGKFSFGGVPNSTLFLEIARTVQDILGILIYIVYFTGDSIFVQDILLTYDFWQERMTGRSLDSPLSKWTLWVGLLISGGSVDS